MTNFISFPNMISKGESHMRESLKKKIQLTKSISKKRLNGVWNLSNFSGLWMMKKLNIETK